MLTTTDAALISLRREIRPDDIAVVRQLVQGTGFFSPAEVEIAVELATDRLEKRTRSDYLFLFAEIDGQMVGYTCYGEIPCTVGSFDLYWIATAVERQGQGIGKFLLRETEEDLLQRGARHVYAETSSRSQYESTRKFYERCGYEAASVLVDFYAPGDGKVTYRKIISPVNG